ncbi:MAG TPA: isoprenyl transferase [Firmicutes bacterium]|nr:isoprenyl transferase [Bacillota bacterium]
MSSLWQKFKTLLSQPALKFKQTSADVQDVLDNTLPQHVAIIMDGNGRWAKRKGLPRYLGHKAGVETIKNVVRWCDEIGIKVLTLYAFSTENWQRPRQEVEFLMSLPVVYLEAELSNLMRNNVKLQVFGSGERLPENTRRAVREAVQKTAGNTGLILNLAFNYGSRNEIIRAVQKIARLIARGELSPDDIDEEMMENYLDTKGLPDPDLLIRPSGELRLSNFLLWQLAYTEFWFSNTMWPDFSKKDFLKAIADYQNRDRRFGGIKL